MTSCQCNILAYACALLLSIQLYSVSSTDDAPKQRPHHMRRKAAIHRNGTASLLKSGTIDSTIDDIKRRQSPRGKLRNARDEFACNDESEETLSGYKCKMMDQMSFVSNAELGSRAATEYTLCDENSTIGFDYINDIWGYESPSGKKYALVGMWDGTSFVDVTDPREPIVIGFLEMAGDLEVGNCNDGFWRDIKVVNGVAYIGAEPKNSGIQIVDLGKLDSMSDLGNNGWYDMSGPLARGDVPRIQADGFIDTIGHSHNIIGFEEDNKVLVVGFGDMEEDVTPACDIEKGETVAILDVSEKPFDPPITCMNLNELNVGNQEPTARMHSHRGYVHDGQCFVYQGPDKKFADVPICIFFAETEIGIYRLDYYGAMISKFSYPGAAFVHQGWISEDFTTLYANDEADEECRSGYFDYCSEYEGGSAQPITRIFDITSLEKPGDAREFVNTRPHPSIDHNMYIQDGHIYSANYQAGARVYKIEEDKSLTEVAYYKVSNDCNDILNCADPFGGVWTHYPFAGSSTTLASNGFYGLHVLNVRLEETQQLFD